MKNFKSLEEVNLDGEKFYKDNIQCDNWKLNYHFEPPFGLINDPNGLSYFNGEYYLFFQWNPYTCEHKYKHWGLVKTKNFIDYTMPKVVIAPTDWYDKDGCYSGSALSHNGKLELIYTGNVKDAKGNRESYQVRAICDDNGSITKVGPVVSDIPKGYTAHFRDPKIFKYKGIYYFIIGAQTEDLKGRVLLYSSEDFNTWTLKGEIETAYKDFGFMWECPGLINMDNKDLFIFSPQGLKGEEFKNQNIYQSGYLIGNLDYDTLMFNHNEFKELDMGFDFYAPQSFRDDKGRDIMIGWMGLPEEDEQHPTSKYNRIHCLTMARELSIKDDVLYQRPLEEYNNLRKELLVDIEGVDINKWVSNNIEENSYEFLLEVNEKNASQVELRFAIGNNEDVTLKYDFEKSIVILDRTNMKLGGKGIRKLKLHKEETFKIQMFMDKSSFEIYLNDGREVMSSRIYPQDGSIGIELLSKGGDIRIDKMKIWNLIGVRYNE
ncbi:glycoside hydrolase family 32 protein [Clostridium vincentii]|uniref:Sucrose-6-phosphate hydrolase n=1 Tax=Clostridium vincentii TaxID=52704 RepID=A0A2T0B6R7_9CLOT|nr:sucrose-6-phosphate hydrolase [Clostridium vincentii]PRR79576.1 Sucrose-6-phosphate hydrolase [Clostridium vincentii]